MRKLFFISALFIIFAGAFASVRAQADIGIRPTLAGGDVTAVSGSKITLQTKDGAIEVVLSDATSYKRIPPENPSLQAAVDSKLSDIGIGDKLLVRGTVSPDKKSVPAKAIYLMTKSDLAQRQAKESEQWRTRGISGKVVSVNPLSKEIIITSRGVMGETRTTITPKDNTRFLRYSQESVKFSDAKQSSLGEINPGDMVRALGDKGENNTFKAEELISGAFQTTAGTVTAIDVEKNEVTVTDVQTKQPVTIVVGNSSVMKQFPAEVAQRLAMMQMAQARGVTLPQGAQGANRPQGNTPPPPPGAQGANRPQGNNAGQTGQGERPGGGMGGNGSIDEMLDRFPNITVADLKVGDTIAVSSSKNSSSGKLNAIKLLSGVEPFLRVPQMSGRGGGGRGGQGGGDTGFSIPGLDDGGFGIP